MYNWEGSMGTPFYRGTSEHICATYFVKGKKKGTKSLITPPPPTPIAPKNLNPP